MSNIASERASEARRGRAGTVRNRASSSRVLRAAGRPVPLSLRSICFALLLRNNPLVILSHE